MYAKPPVVPPSQCRYAIEHARARGEDPACRGNDLNAGDGEANLHAILGIWIGGGGDDAQKAK